MKRKGKKEGGEHEVAAVAKEEESTKSAGDQSTSNSSNKNNVTEKKQVKRGEKEGISPEETGNSEKKKQPQKQSLLPPTLQNLSPSQRYSTVLSIACFIVLISCIVFLSFTLYQLRVEFGKERESWHHERLLLQLKQTPKTHKNRSPPGFAKKTVKQVKRMQKPPQNNVKVKKQPKPQEKNFKVKGPSNWTCELVEAKNVQMTWDDPVFSTRFSNLSQTLTREIFSTKRTATDMSYQLSKNLTSEFQGNLAMTFIWRERDTVALYADVVSGFYSTHRWQGRVVTTILQPKSKKTTKQTPSSFETAARNLINSSKGNVTQRVTTVYRQLKSSSAMSTSYFGVLGYESGVAGNGVGYIIYPENGFSFKTQAGNFSFSVFVYHT